MTEEEQNKLAREFMKLKWLTWIEQNKEELNKEISALIEKTQQVSASEEAPHDNGNNQSATAAEQARNAAETVSPDSP